VTTIRRRLGPVMAALAPSGPRVFALDPVHLGKVAHDNLNFNDLARFGTLMRT
jgi:hypothetical protein